MHKYVFTGLIMNHDSGVKLKQIKSVRNFGLVKKGDIGGWIERTKNLSHKGLCWVYNDAKVFDYARVTDNALVLKYAEVHGFAKIKDDSVVKHNAKVLDEAVISDRAIISDHAIVKDNSSVSGTCNVAGYSVIADNTVLMKDVAIYGKSIVSGDLKIDSGFIRDSKVTLLPIVLYGLDYVVVITDNHMTIGCKHYKIESWFNFSDKEIKKMHFCALEFWRNYKNLLKQICIVKRGLVV